MSKARQLVNDLQWAGIILVVYGVLISAWLVLQWVGWFISEHSWFLRTTALLGV